MLQMSTITSFYQLLFRFTNIYILVGWFISLLPQNLSYRLGIFLRILLHRIKKKHFLVVDFIVIFYLQNFNRYHRYKNKLTIVLFSLLNTPQRTTFTTQHTANITSDFFGQLRHKNMQLPLHTHHLSLYFRDNLP